MHKLFDSARHRRVAAQAMRSTAVSSGSTACLARSSNESPRKRFTATLRSTRACQLTLSLLSGRNPEHGSEHHFHTTIGQCPWRQNFKREEDEEDCKVWQGPSGAQAPDALATTPETRDVYRILAALDPSAPSLKDTVTVNIAFEMYCALLL